MSADIESNYNRNIEEEEYSEEQPEEEECFKCGKFVDKILTLRCEHNQCLECAARGLITTESTRQEQYSCFTCEICNFQTIIDPRSVKVLQVLASNLYVHQSKTPLNISKNAIQSPPTGSNMRSPSESSGITGKYGNDRRTQGGNQSLQDITNVVKSTIRYPAESQPFSSQMFYKSGETSNIIDNHPNESYLNEQESLEGTCEAHPDEEAVLFCFDCEGDLFCLECYLRGRHQAHEVKNIKKSSGELNAVLKSLKQKVRTKVEGLLQDENRLENKKKELVDVVNGVKEQIRADFDEITRRLRMKENELLSTADNFLEDNFKDLERVQERVRNHLEKLSVFDRDLEKHIVGRKENLISEYKSFSYYQKFKQTIIKAIEFTDTPLINKVTDKLNYRYFLNPESLITHIEAVKVLKFESATLRGLEGVRPSKEEEYYFKLSKDRRDKENAARFLKEARISKDL